VFDRFSLSVLLGSAAGRHAQPSKMTTPLRIQIDTLAYGAHGVGRLDGKATFVRGVIPGEQVEIVVREDHGRYAYADLIAVLEPAAERRHPPCPYLPRCGGCPWQHMEYEAQLAAKQRNLRETLARIGHWRDAPVKPIVASASEFQYRSRLSLRIHERRLGFYAAGSHELVEIDHCLLATDAINDALVAAAELVRLVPDDARRVEVLTCERTAAIVLVAEVEGSRNPATSALIDAWLPQQAVAGVVLHGRRWRQAWGRQSVSVYPEPDLELTATAGSFTQVNPSANRELVRHVLELGEFSPQDHVLDLYAGIGNLSLPIARRAQRVVAVEQNALAAGDARVNARAAKLANVEVHTATTRSALRALSAQRARFDVVVLDPPRSGAAEAIDAVLTLAPERIVYVSCNPATLARDLAKLLPSFAFDVIQPVDLFPQTYHLETVARGRRR